jgi:hypothetical protein
LIIEITYLQISTHIIAPVSGDTIINPATRESSAAVIKDSIRQSSAQIAKLTIKLVTPGVLSESEAKKVHTYLAFRQEELNFF